MYFTEDELCMALPIVQRLSYCYVADAEALELVIFKATLPMR